MQFSKSDSLPPHDLTVTSIDQAHKLENFKNKEVTYAGFQGSEQWLKNHGLDALKLKMKDLVDKGKTGNLEEAKEFVSGIEPGGGCNLLKAFKQILKVKELDSLCLVLGSLPDQKQTVLLDYVLQTVAGCDLPLHTVAYDTNNHYADPDSRYEEMELLLKQLAEETYGRFHCYSSTVEDQIYTSSDISLILEEIKKAQGLLGKIKDMRQGMLDNAVVSIMNEINLEVAKIPSSKFLPRPPGHEMPLVIEQNKAIAKSNEEWMKQNSLKGRRLDLYQVLSPNSYSYKEGFIPVIRKAVQSQVHQRAMVQFTWHDGTERNVHVDQTELFEYQKNLGAVVKLFEKRIDWLSQGSRRIVGTISEENVVILIDLSISNCDYIIHIQHSIRLLLEQQLTAKRYFNIITWILNLQCGGSRNFLAAYRLATENDTERSHGVVPEGIYLFTSGVPDQPEPVVCSFLESSCCGTNTRLHAILFNVDDYNINGPIPGRYANITKTADCLRSMAHCTGGRFHWFRETGIIESDDIRILSTEIDKAINFSQKCAMLIDAVKVKYGRPTTEQELESRKAIEYIKNLSIEQAPRQTALSLARMQLAENRDKQPQAIPKTLAWAPNGMTNGRTKEMKLYSNVQSRLYEPRRDPMRRVKSEAAKDALFYLDGNISHGKVNDIGKVVSRYPSAKSVRKKIVRPVIPQKQEQISTKDWLRMYGINRLRLDLIRLVSGPDCMHKEKNVKSLGKTVSAKYCKIFPSINVNGTVKHLQFLPHELVDYEEQMKYVLQRYVARLQWLLSDSRRIFGVIVQSCVTLLIDTSGSMEASISHLKKELVNLVWDQFHRNGIKFNMIQFSDSCNIWSDGLMEPTDAHCHNAVMWISELEARGGTQTLQALTLAFDDSETDGIYLVSDGKPDTSTSLVLREVAKMNQNRGITVNTIAFASNDKPAEDFLKLLAAETGGRYHKPHEGYHVDTVLHQLLSDDFDEAKHQQDMQLPTFDGDDLRRLSAEITQARNYLRQSRYFRTMSDQHTEGSDDQLPDFDIDLHAFAPLESPRRTTVAL